MGSAEVSAAVTAMNTKGAPAGNTAATSALKMPLKDATTAALVAPIDGCGMAYVVVSCDATMGIEFKGLAEINWADWAIHVAVMLVGYTVLVQNAW